MPIEFRCPGLKWRKQGGRRVAYWICRGRAAENGYPVKSARLWTGEGEPTQDEMAAIRVQCHRLQGEAHEWARGGKTRRRKPPGFVYFAEVNGSVKIGFAVNVRTRLSSLQTASRAPLRLLGTVPGSAEVESFLHWQFRALRERGEWFRLADELRDFIERYANKPGNDRGTRNGTERIAVENQALD